MTSAIVGIAQRAANFYFSRRFNIVLCLVAGVLCFVLYKQIAGPGVQGPSDAQESSTAPATLPPPAMRCVVLAISPVPAPVRFANPSAAAPQGPTVWALFDAMWAVESSRSLNPPDGDGGKAIGPYQIWEAYWIDSRMPYGTYADCRDRAYAEQVMRRYWRRYCPAALASLDFETLARTHNGGPRGATSRRAVTDGYWASVKRTMEEAK